MYIMVKTCINLAFAIFMVSNFTKNSSFKHFHTIDQILHYLTKSQDKSISLREKRVKTSKKFGFRPNKRSC